MSNKKVIVTGATGQDGSNMIDYLLRTTDHDIFGIVRRLSVPNHKNLSEAIKNPRLKLISADLGDQHSLNKLVEHVKPEYFFNFAAQSFVAESWNTPENTFNINSQGVLRCLEAIRQNHPACRFYSAGSSEEWGDVLYSPQDIDHPIRPRSPYGASKAAARHIVKVYRESYNLYAVHGILFNHEGVRRGEEFVTRKITKGVARIARAIEHGERFDPIELGNLDAKRDWSDSEDFVEGVWRILNQDTYRKDLVEDRSWAAGGSILLPGAWEKKIAKDLSKVVKEYVLSSGETHTVREFIEKAFAAAGIKTVWRHFHDDNFNVDMSPLGECLKLPDNEAMVKKGISHGILVQINPKFYRPAEVDLLIGDSTPAREELGWQPKVSFDELVSKMVKNDLCLTNQNS